MQVTLPPFRTQSCCPLITVSGACSDPAALPPSVASSPDLHSKDNLLALSSYFTQCVDVTHFIHLSVLGCLGCLQMLAIVMSAGAAVGWGCTTSAAQDSLLSLCLGDPVCSQ